MHALLCSAQVMGWKTVHQVLRQMEICTEAHTAMLEDLSAEFGTAIHHNSGVKGRVLEASSMSRCEV